MLATGLIVVGGCQRNTESLNDSPRDQRQSINQLEQRLEKLERLLSENKERIGPQTKPDQKTPSGRIKSLTFRIGTQDDRLRIYWADGTKSDLPCTKEQFIWACG